ncbi:MAG TPA: VWA domain-containing protein [Verrucomicrobiales bacterium]|jgi:Ca-activated chloride channel family protein|nr:VWA domain-containing protein [Verrucomicrobiales bacterium]
MAETPLKFAWPWLLAAAVILPLLVLSLHRLNVRAAKRKLGGVIAPRLRSQLLRSVSFGKRRWKALLCALGIGFLVAAIARPQMGFQSVEVERSSVDFFIALDLSRSMLAEDMVTDAGKPQSRLEAARTGIVSFLDSLGSDRAGLIVFAGDAFLASPITQDHETLKRNLASVDPRTIAHQGSDMAKAINLAVKTFEKGKYDSKALVLVTDGEELQGEAVIAAREAARKGISLFTVGVGTSAGARIPDRQDGGPLRFAQNEFHRDVLTRLNEHMLQQLAASGRGFYKPVGKEGGGLKEVWERGLVPLAKGTQTRPSKDMQEYFQWPLALALLLLLWEMLVSDRRNALKVSRP